MIKRLTVIGVGLIGGSLAMALRQAGAVGEIVGAGRNAANLRVAEERGIIDSYTTDIVAAVDRADMVVIAVSLGATAAVLEGVSHALADTAVVTDVGSSKRGVVNAARAALGSRFPRFVPGHPIAGTEHSGAGAAFADLFVGHKVVLTALDETDRSALESVRAMWRASGAEPVEMDVDAHDRALAATSHLPHLLAYNLVDTLARRDDAGRIFDFAAGGFRDFTRIASSNPQMWTEIALANRDELLAAARDYSARFEILMQALEGGDAATLRRVFQSAKQTRDACIVPEPNEGE
jgi:prephenate dehydrogenase